MFEIIRSGLDPAALELLDPNCIRLINLNTGMNLSEKPTLFIEFHGPSQNYLKEVGGFAQEICESHNCIDFMSGLGREERDEFFSARHSLSEMITRNHPDCSFLSGDSAVPISAYPEIIAMAGEEVEKNNLRAYIFSHAGDGNLHVKFAGKKDDEKEWSLIRRINEKNSIKSYKPRRNRHGRTWRWDR